MGTLWEDHSQFHPVEKDNPKRVTGIEQIMILVMLLVVFLALSQFVLIYSQQILTYTTEHLQCSTLLTPTSPTTTTTTATTASTYCQNASYVEYFSNILTKNNGNGVTDFQTLIAKTILNLYEDLKKQRKPYLCPLTYTYPYLEKTKHIDHVLIHPITFCIPEENILMTIPSKRKAFGQVIPGYPNTYFHLHNETLYFQDMQASLYVITYKKGGWDCLRHYEILATGALPLFVHIKNCPSTALATHPKQLYQLLLQQPGLQLKATRTGQHVMHFDELALNLPQVDQQLYSAIVQAMLQYSRNVLSTKAMAKYVLQTMFDYSYGYIKSPHPKRVFYLTHQDKDMDKGDYMTDFLLHGLIALLGADHVTDFPVRQALYKTPSTLNHTDYLQHRSTLYGSGFSWSMKLDVLQDTTRNMEEIKSKLSSHYYDIVILGSGHRDGWASKLHFWDIICKVYHPLEVGFVDGADYHLRKRTLDKYTPCAGHLFSREGFVSGFEHNK